MNGSNGVINLPLQTERQRIEGELKKALRGNLSDGPLFITNDERGITVHILEELLFGSGSAEFKKNSLATLDTLALVLKKLPNDIRVEGHTDNVPIKTAQYPSNWHLSVARAVNAGYYLIDKHGLVPERVSVVGYAEYRPLIQNSSNENRARNRRVDIVILTEGARGQTIIEGDNNAPSSLTK
jgi:chemotaxis protein MotB